jgi:uncharacterized protein YjbI with pentapeptide repeats
VLFWRSGQGADIEGADIEGADIQGADIHQEGRLSKGSDI